MSRDKKTILSVRSLSKDFSRPNGNLFTVLENINLDLYDGEFLAIVGLSGSGKSTLLRCMAGLLQPERGIVSYAQPPAENIQLAAFVFQHFALFPWMNIRQNIAVSIPNISKLEKDERIDKIVHMIGLKGFEDAYPRELSGGMQQLVSFARAMVADPMIMFMDEPFSALDPLTSESLRAELLRIWLQKERKIRATVLVTHRFEEALQLANRIIILSSHPGSIFKTIDINLPYPRIPSSKEFQELEEILEKSFVKLHLDTVTLPSSENLGIEYLGSQTQPTRFAKIKPLIKTSLTLVEGLISRLNNEDKNTDLYDLCEDMGQSVDQVLPAVAAAETLAFVNTPGIEIVLTEKGRRFAQELDSEIRSDIMRESILTSPLIAAIYKMVEQAGEEGLEKQIAVEQIVTMLPFEDHDLQFQTLLKWCRHANLLVYDSDEEKLFIPE